MEFTWGSVVSQAFGVYFKRFATYFLIALVASIPSLLASIAMRSVTVAAGETGTLLVYRLIQTLAWLLSQGLAAGMVVSTVFGQLQGKTVSLGDALRTGVSFAMPVMLVVFVSALLITVGFALLLIPGLIFLSMLYVATPALIAEKLSVGGAFSRSAELTKGLRNHVVSVPFALGLLALIIFWALARAVDETTPGHFLLSELISTVFVGLNGVAAAVSYHRLRRIRDGLDEDSLAAVFD
ncbi:MAG: hypothetical protein KC609_03670 [Myxococcales bacterium]|nr:hypothetical protein [Myxococcales bacterium]